MAAARYDRIGTTYSRHRQPDPRVAAQIDRALGDARLVLDVGAGTGSYETGDRRYVAAEPSTVMLSQRRPDAAPAAQAVAEHLPFGDGAFDAALATLTIHHWTDPAAGIAEVRRVTDGPFVILTWEGDTVSDHYWLVRDYLPEAAAFDDGLVRLTEIVDLLGGDCRVEPVPVPHDCVDGFFAAYWRRPEAYLDPSVRAAISGLALLDDASTERMVVQLRADIESGAWHERHADLLELDEYDAGYRLVIASV